MLEKGKEWKGRGMAILWPWGTTDEGRRTCHELASLSRSLVRLLRFPFGFGKRWISFPTKPKLAISHL